MSYNKTLNAVIALIEGRPEVTREILRSPEINEKINVSEVNARLYQAIERSNRNAVREALRNLLRKTMTLTPSSDAYLDGVVMVEKLIEDCFHENECLEPIQRDLPLS